MLFDCKAPFPHLLEELQCCCLPYFQHNCPPTQQNDSLDIWTEVQFWWQKFARFLWLLGKQPFAGRTVNCYLQNIVAKGKSGFYQPGLRSSDQLPPGPRYGSSLSSPARICCMSMLFDFSCPCLYSLYTSLHKILILEELHPGEAVSA